MDFFVVKSARHHHIDDPMHTRPACDIRHPRLEENIILQLMQAFERIPCPTDSLDRLSIETEKLRIIKAFESIIHQKIDPKNPTIPQQEESVVDVFQQYCRQVLYYFLLIVGLFEDAAEGYVFWLELFSLLPRIPHSMLVFLSISSTILGGFLFYSFEVTFLHDAIGIHGSNTELSQLLNLYSKQLETTLLINQMLSNVSILLIENNEYDDYLQLLAQINQDLRIKHAAMGHYPESNLKYILKMIALTFGACSSIASSYITAHALLTTLAASWVGMPIGWALMMTAVIVDLGFYYAMGATSTARLINPEFDNYQEIEKELGLFTKRYQDDLNHIRTIKNRFFERKPTRNASTQIDEFEQDHLQMV